MPQLITYVELFLASPSDVEVERETVANLIHDWNTRRSRHEAVFFNLLRWEDSVSAGFDRDGQSVINEQIGNDYDVLIALFWTRFGTPTINDRSGTAEEYHRAFARFKKGEKVEIAFYFKDAPISVSDIDTDQLHSLNEFRKEVQVSGALTKTFKDVDGLRLEMGLLLDRLARKFGGGAVLSVGPPAPNSPLGDSVSSVDKVEFDDDDAGLFDALENLQQNGEKAGAFLEELTHHLNKSAEETSSITSEFEVVRNVRPLEPGDMRPGLDRISDNMDEFSIFLESRMPAYAEDITSMAGDVRDIVRVSYDWIDGNDDAAAVLTPFKDSIATAVAMMSKNEEGMSYLSDTIGTLPRATSKFNRSRRRFVQNAKKYDEIGSSARALMEQGLNELLKLVAEVEVRKAKREM